MESGRKSNFGDWPGVSGAQLHPGSSAVMRKSQAKQGAQRSVYFKADEEERDRAAQAGYASAGRKDYQTTGESSGRNSSEFEQGVQPIKPYVDKIPDPTGQIQQSEYV